jgi:hypothetical protein
VLLDVPYRRVADVDTTRLEQLAKRLGPLFEPEDAPLWTVVRERSRYIGQTERPADVGFRKMHPTGYVQLCVVNDEDPFSPWAVRIPHDVLSATEQKELAEEYAAFCRRLYGEGTLYFLVFAVLAPGGTIPSHRDMPHDPNKKAFSHHLHIPVTAAPDTEFVLRDQKVVLEAGAAYEIDNMSPHSVINRGTTHRVNVMLDYCPADKLAVRNV